MCPWAICYRYQLSSARVTVVVTASANSAKIHRNLDIFIWLTILVQSLARKASQPPGLPCAPLSWEQLDKFSPWSGHRRKTPIFNNFIVCVGKPCGTYETVNSYQSTRVTLVFL